MKPEDITVGMRVECIKRYDLAPIGAVGEVVVNGRGVGVMWDEEYPGCHNLGGKAPNNHGEWTYAEYLEPEYKVPDLNEEEYTKILNAV